MRVVIFRALVITSSQGHSNAIGMKIWAGPYPSSQLRARREICTTCVNLKSPNQAISEKVKGGENHIEQMDESGWLYISFQN